MINTVLTLLQIVLSIALIALIAVQGKGGGLGSAFGANYTSFSKRRGVEKLVFNTTIILAVLFFITSLLNLVV